MIGGVELRKRRSLGDIVSDAFTILQVHWKPLVIIAFPGFAVSLAYSMLSYLLEDELGLNVLLALISLPLQFIIFVLVGGGTVFYLDRVSQGETPTAQDALDAAQAKLGALVGATFRSLVIVLLLIITIIGIPFAIYRGVRWVFISQAVMLDGKVGEEVLAHSASLVENNWWLTVGRSIVTGLVVAIPAQIIAALATVAFPGAIGALVEAATIFITVPYGIIATTLVFFDYKLEKSSDAANASTPR
jgi:hypothetical protein